MKIFTSGLLCLLLIFSGAVGAQAAEPGTYTPGNYSLVDDPGLQRLIKAEGKGKIVIVSFFASWCGPCRKEVPQLVRLRSKVTEDDMLILGVNFDYTQEELERFLKRVKINFPIYVAATNEFTIEGKPLIIRTIPRMLVYDAQGKLVQNIEGVLPEATFNRLVDYLLENAI